MIPHWSEQASYRLYENLGEFDPTPTHKQEFEVGIARTLPYRQSIALSFRHHLFDSRNDQFSFLKLK